MRLVVLFLACVALAQFTNGCGTNDSPAQKSACERDPACAAALDYTREVSP
jgi:hypothetical protein